MCCNVYGILDFKMDVIKNILIDEEFLMFELKGISMLPTYKEADCVKIVPFKNSYDLMPNDIILFFDKNYKLALHRLIGCVGNTYILKGDNVNVFDYITKKNIIGKIDDSENINNLNLKNKKIIETLNDIMLIVELKESKIVSINAINK